MNEGHHEYMGKHTDIMEGILKDAFPGESDDFYNYGEMGRRCDKFISFRGTKRRGATKYFTLFRI